MMEEVFKGRNNPSLIALPPPRVAGSFFFRSLLIQRVRRKWVGWLVGGSGRKGKGANERTNERVSFRPALIL